MWSCGRAVMENYSSSSSLMPSYDFSLRPNLLARYTEHMRRQQIRKLGQILSSALSIFYYLHVQYMHNVSSKALPSLSIQFNNKELGMREWETYQLSNFPTRTRSPLSKFPSEGGAYVPSRREFNKQLTSIQHIDTQIHGLLGLIKDRHNIPVYNQPKPIRNQVKLQQDEVKTRVEYSKTPPSRQEHKITSKQQLPRQLPKYSWQAEDKNLKRQAKKSISNVEDPPRTYLNNYSLAAEMANFKRRQYLNTENQRSWIDQLDYNQGGNRFPYLGANGRYERRFVPERSKSPILLVKPVSKYIKPTQQKERQKTASTKRASYSRSVSPAERLKTSRETVQYLNAINTVEDFQPIINDRETCPEHYDSKNIPEERSSLEQSKHTEIRIPEDQEDFTEYQPSTPVQKIAQSSLRGSKESLRNSFKMHINEENPIANSQLTVSFKPTGREEIQGSKRSMESMNSEIDRDFEIKLYPCDINPSTIKAFIANKLTQIVKVDMELDEFRANYCQNKNPQKKKILTKCLWDRGWRVDQQQAEEYIGVNSFSVPSTFKPLDADIETLIDNLVDKFLEGEYYWDKKIHCIITENEVKATNFSGKSLDLEKRGFLKVEDFTCFLNLYASGRKNYKNRDLKTLFQRFTRDQDNPGQLPYAAFIDQICGSSSPHD